MGKEKKKKEGEELERDRGTEGRSRYNGGFLSNVLTITAVNQNFWGDLIFSFVLWNSAASHGKVTQLCQVSKAKILRWSPDLWVLMVEV